jgi:hypothetical protein
MIGPPIGGANSFLPDAAYSPGCGYLVTWEVRGGVSSQDNVFARHVMPKEAQHMNDPFPIDDSSEEQARPAVACAPYGDCFVVEEDMWSGNWDIRGRFVRFHRTRLPLIMRHGP